MKKIIKNSVIKNILKKNIRAEYSKVSVSFRFYQMIKFPKMNFSNQEKTKEKKDPKKIFEKQSKTKEEVSRLEEEQKNEVESFIETKKEKEEKEETKIEKEEPKTEKKLSKKNFNIIKKKNSLKESLIHLWQTIKKSLKDLKNDTIYIYHLRKNKGKLVNFNINEYLRYRSVVYDLIKFAPYSLFLTIPFMELLLPLYLVIFPNSIPSQFFSEKTIGEINNAFKMKQKKGYQILKSKLYIVFKEDFIKIKKEINIIKDNENDLEIKNRILQLDKELMKKIDNEWDSYYSKKLKFRYLNSKEKEAILNLFYIEYITGTNLINLVVNIPKSIYKYSYRLIKQEYPETKYIKVHIPFFPFVNLQNSLFWLQMKYHFRRLKFEDDLMKKNITEQISGCNIFDIFNIVRKRGFDISSEEDCRKFLENVWFQDIDYKELDKSIWKIVVRHSYAEYLV
jgi:hypothetical protein